MAASAQIQKLGPKHYSMIQWLIENPTGSRADMALHFKVSRSWLSIVINSDAFQAELHRRQTAVFNSGVAAPLKARVMGAVHIAADKLLDRLELETDTNTLVRTVVELSRVAGEHQGDVKSAPAIHNNQLNINGRVDAETLARAREMIGKARQATGQTYDAGDMAADDLPKLPDSRRTGVGASHFQAALHGPRQDQESEVSPWDQVREESRREVTEALSGDLDRGPMVQVPGSWSGES